MRKSMEREIHWISWLRHRNKRTVKHLLLQAESLRSKAADVFFGQTIREEMDAEPMTGLLLGRLPEQKKGREVSATCCSSLYICFSLCPSPFLRLAFALAISLSLASCALLKLYVCVTGVGLSFFSNKSKIFFVQKPYKLGRCKNYLKKVTNIHHPNIQRSTLIQPYFTLSTIIHSCNWCSPSACPSLHVKCYLSSVAPEQYHSSASYAHWPGPSY